MSEENVEIVRRLYRAMDVGDLDAVPAHVHPDAQWIPDRRVGVGPVRGRDNVIQFFADRAEMFGGLQTDLERLWDVGDRVLAFIRVTGTGETSGAGFDIRVAHVWTVRDGLVVRGEGYGDRDEALKAAGVRE